MQVLRQCHLKCFVVFRLNPPTIVTLRPPNPLQTLGINLTPQVKNRCFARDESAFKGSRKPVRCGDGPPFAVNSAHDRPCKTRLALEKRYRVILRNFSTLPGVRPGPVPLDFSPLNPQTNRVELTARSCEFVSGLSHGAFSVQPSPSESRARVQRVGQRTPGMRALASARTFRPTSVPVAGPHGLPADGRQRLRSALARPLRPSRTA